MHHLLPCRLLSILFLFFIFSFQHQSVYAEKSDKKTISIEKESNATTENESTEENLNQQTQDETALNESENTLLPVEDTTADESTPSLYANIVFREKTIFKIYYKNEKQKNQTLNRAAKATAALEEAMNANTPLEPDSPQASVNFNTKHQLEVRVRGYKIAEFTNEDRAAAGYKSLKDYQEALLTELNIFVGNEFKRLQIQKLSLKFFLSVFFALLGFLSLRQARVFFNSADLNIEEKRESLKPMTFMSETLISSQALGGFFALFLVFGRVLTYFVVTLATAAAILGQFTTTRNAMGNALSKIFSDSLAYLQSMLEFLPGLVLAVILLFLWNISIKILDLFLRGVRSGRISWSFLQANRIAIVRFWGISLLSLLFFPLILASLFGRFNNPLEFVVIACAIILCISTLPILISVTAGSFILWFGQIKPGQWIKIGKTIGEVADVSLFKITLIPPNGGRIFIPMFQLLYQSYTEMGFDYQREFHFKIERHMSLEDSISKVQGLFPTKLNVNIKCLSLSGNEYKLSILTSSFNSDTKRTILSSLSMAHDQKLIVLTSDLIEEM